ncbi:MAG TPA: tetratricopeptide repeat protein [Polyangiaceae bacterium]|nr:tetratricopeptide repeat protein [Polyangiaceae bacterium]
MKRLLLGSFVAVSLAVTAASPSRGAFGGATVADVADAITELDVVRARALLAQVPVDSASLALERARLSLYVGDCDTASATLATLSGVREAASLAELAKACAKATAGAVVIEDQARGLWIRLQDEADRVLVPQLSEVAANARAAIERDLGVVMPRPLRIDLVRDHFSLSAVSGLPLQAAETTGTVAVARWGRVNLISPRAAPSGFPWEDTLAHEITHLAVTRATRDAAPLWLQEGLAKRQETRWRSPRPFDGEPRADDVAKNALVTGQSVGVDKLGPSIAMLPSADAASTAFAEVSSFVDYWIAENGRPALRLLFADLKGMGMDSASDALSSVSGYDLDGWVLRWQDHLLHLPEVKPGPAGQDPLEALERELLGSGIAVAGGRDRARALRVAELLLRRGRPDLAAPRLREALVSAPSDPALRFRLGQSFLASGRADLAAPLFRSDADLDYALAGWFALQGRVERGAGDPRAAEGSFELGVALDPYQEDAACEGEFTLHDAAGKPLPAPLPSDPARRALCESARKIRRD